MTVTKISQTLAFVLVCCFHHYCCLLLLLLLFIIIIIITIIITIVTINYYYYYSCVLFAAQASRRDWVSGDVDVPKFHCPRCRDHWYGYSSVPCDEELARLIREGLWYTGNKEKHAQASYKPGMFATGESQATSKEAVGVSGGTSQKGKLPRLKSSYKKTGSSGHGDWQWNRDDGDAKKKKKRITFKLDDSGSDGSSTDLNTDGHGSGRRVGGANGMDDGTRGDSNLVKNSKASGTGRLGGDGMNGSVGNTGEGNALADNNRQGVSTNGGTGSGDSSNQGHAMSSRNGGTGSTGSNSINSNNASSNGDTVSGKLTSGLGNMNITGTTGSSLNSANPSGRYDGSKHLLNRSDESGLANGGSSGHDKGFNSMTGREEEAGRFGHGGNTFTDDDDGAAGNKLSDGRDGSGNETRKSRNNSRDSSGLDASGDGDMSSTHPVDHGKRIRKSGGYMKAVSPTSSEWGDHLHAHSFISSSVHSRSGSISSMSGVKNGRNGSSTDTEGRDPLPPIVPRIIGVDHHLPDWTPGFTRAWTFSYFRN